MNALMQWAIDSNRLWRCFSALTGPYVAIFTLHRPEPEDQFFNGISEALLERCLSYAAARGYDFVSIDEVVERAVRGAESEASRPMLCFTLDDGYEDQMSRLLPLLMRYQAKPTLFTITDFTDDKDWPWDAKLAFAVKNSPVQRSEVPLGNKTWGVNLSSHQARILSRRRVVKHAKTLRASEVGTFVAEVEAACEVTIPERAPEGYRPVSWERLRELEADGLRIGSHSQSHNLLNAMDDRRVENELSHSRSRLHTELTNPSNVFCYPSGTTSDFARRHETLVRSAGYHGAASTISKIAYFRELKRNPYRVNRIGFPSDFEQFARYASWLEALRSKLPA